MANDQMTLRVEAEANAQGLSERIEEAIREVTKLRGQVEIVEPGSLPNDGKIISRRRPQLQVARGPCHAPGDGASAGLP